MPLLIKIALIWTAAIVTLLILWTIVITRGKRDHVFISIDPSAPKKEVDRADNERAFKRSA